MDKRLFAFIAIIGLSVIVGGIYVFAGIGDSIQLSDATTTQIELKGGETKYCNTMIFDGSVCGFAGDGDPALIDNCADDPPYTCFKIWVNEKHYNEKTNSIVCPRDFLKKNLEKAMCADSRLSERGTWSIFPEQIFYLQDNGQDYVCRHDYDENNIEAMYSENCDWEILRLDVPEDSMRIHWASDRTYICNTGEEGYKRWRDNLCVPIK